MKLKLLGAPGCGKTTRLMEYLEQELESGTKPDRVSFLTFTRAAREEALSRTGKTEADFPFLRTIHSICYRQLLISQDQLIKPKDLRYFGKTIGIKLNGNNLDPWVEEFERTYETPTRDDLLLQINHCGRHREIHLKQALENASPDIDYKYATWFTKAYRNWKDIEGRLDYTDLLIEYLERGQPLDIDVMFVDESQDLSKLQWEVVNKLGANAQRWYCAGDDDQSIFTWAGADSDAFQDMVADKVEILGQSYRVSKAVHKTALSIVSRIKHRIAKTYSPTNSEGEVVDVGYLSYLDFKDKTFILFRNNYRGQEIAKYLKLSGTPFIGHGSPLLEVDVRAALLGWVHLVKKGEVEAKLAKRVLKYSNKRLVQDMASGRIKQGNMITVDGLFTIRPKIGEWARFMNGLPGIDILDTFVRKVGLLHTAGANIELMSIHQSKGKESHTVVLDTEISRATWESYLVNPDDEHRVWYVGSTRAKEKLLLLLPDGNLSYKI